MNSEFRRPPLVVVAFAVSAALALAVAACGTPVVSSSPSASGSETQAMAFTQTVCDAFRTRDLPTLERLLAPEFTLVGTDAVVQPRTQAIAEVEAGEPRYEIFRNHDMTAQVYGDAAVVSGITSLKGTASGRPFAIDVRFTDVLVRSDGRWRIVTSHVTRVPPK